MDQEGFPVEVLIENASRVLGGLEQSSARVQERPDVRTIRYYASLGLLDKPLYFQGRTAFYGEKHVAQLVAIKRLQAQQLRLQEIQHRLLGLSEEALFALAELPRTAPPATRRRHWTALPIPLPGVALPEVKNLLSIRLNAAVTLSVEGLPQRLSRVQLEKLLEASGPLLELLTSFQDDTK